MDDTDREILTIIQGRFPLVRRPFAEIAEKVGLTEGEVISRIGALKHAGVIRRIGAVLDAKSLGAKTMLCAATVPEGRIERVAAVVGSFGQVTHNYEREGPLNLWFTVWGKDTKELAQTVEEIERKAGITVVRLGAVKTYKIRAVFDMPPETP